MLPPDLRVTTSFVIAEQGEWFEEELEFAATHLARPGAAVLDIGASYGLYSLALSAAVAPSGTVTSFEPHPGSVKALTASLTANDCSNVVLAATALSDRVGTARLACSETPELSVLHPYGSGSGGAEAREGGAALAAVAGGGADQDSGTLGAGGVVVPVTTLDRYAAESELALHDVSFVKMDVEGSEAAVVRGGHQLFGPDGPSPVVLFEVSNAGEWNGEAVGVCGGNPMPTVCCPRAPATKNV
jgi:FkbM family methyltransferase